MKTFAGFAIAAVLVWLMVWLGNAFYQRHLSPQAQQRLQQEWQSYRQQGRDACADGIPAEACQHSGLNRKLWMEGWQDYRREHPVKQ